MKTRTNRSRKKKPKRSLPVFKKTRDGFQREGKNVIVVHRKTKPDTFPAEASADRYNTHQEA